jgi:hypothetical protein
MKMIGEESKPRTLRTYDRAQDRVFRRGQVIECDDLRFGKSPKRQHKSTNEESYDFFHWSLELWVIDADPYGDGR